MLENELENQPSAEELGTAIGGEGEGKTQEPERSLREEILANVKTVNERPRDEQGRFKPQEKQEPPQEGKEPPQDGQQPQDKQAKPAKEGTQQPQPEAASQPPTSWSPEAKAEFGKLPRAVQDAISKREAEVHRGFTAQDEERTLGKQFREVAAPYMPIIQAEGGTPVTAFQTLLNSAYILRQGTPAQKTALVKDLISRYNIVLDGTTAPPPDPQVTPQPQPLQPGLTEEQVRQIAAETQRFGHIQGMIAAFEADPANVHFQKVRPVMSALLTAGAATSLKDAYDKACRADPEISSSLAAEQAKAAEDKRQAEIRQKATAAKHAGGSVTGGPGATTVPAKVKQPDRSLREELEHNFAQLTQPRI